AGRPRPAAARAGPRRAAPVARGGTRRRRGDAPLPSGAVIARCGFGDVVGSPIVLETDRSRGDDVTQLLDTVKTYAKQETIGPLKGIGRSIGFGLGGVLCLGIGTISLLVGVLRVLQTETSVFEGNWSFVPYVI